jgi:hypothetical protein
MDATLVCVQGDGEDAAVVCVSDRREGAYLEIPTERPVALDTYDHPFAYRDFSTVDHQDRRLAAETEMIQVGAYPTRSDAELAQTALTAAGIPSVVASDDAGSVYPFDLTGAARLLVEDAYAEDAAELLCGRPNGNPEE